MNHHYDSFYRSLSTNVSKGFYADKGGFSFLMIRLALLSGAMGLTPCLVTAQTALPVTLDGIIHPDSDDTLLKPTDWKLTFDGKTVTLDPSIGNWSFPCRSHYWVRNNRVQWADDWSDARIEANREYDRRAKDRYFSETEGAGRNIPGAEPSTPEPATKRTWWKRLWPW